MSAWNAAGVQIHFEYYYWYWIDLVTTTRLLSIQYPYRFGITTWKPITRHNSWKRKQIYLLQTNHFTTLFTAWYVHYMTKLFYYTTICTTRGPTLNELLAAIAARHSPVLSGGELSIILPSGQSNGECRYWLLRSGDIQILFCCARTLLCMYETT